MINVLIFPAGTEIGREIYLSLRNEKNINLVLAGADYDSHARHYACGYHIVPDVSHQDGLPALQTLLVQESIDYIFPAHDEVLLFLSENRDALSATVLCPSQEACRITRFKSKTYQALKGTVPLPLYSMISVRSATGLYLPNPTVGKGHRELRALIPRRDWHQSWRRGMT